MKPERTAPGQIRRLALAGIAGGLLAIVLLMPYHAFLSTWLGTAIGPLLLFKSWKELLLVLMAVLALGFLATRPDIGRQLARQPLTMVVGAYALLHLLLAAAYANPLLPSLAGLATNLRFLLIFLLAQLLLLAAPRLAGRLRRWLGAGLLVSAGIISLFGLLQVTLLPPEFLSAFGYDKQATIAPYLLIDEQAGALRAFATLRGPNTLGMFLLLPLAIAAVLVIRRRSWRWALPLLLAMLAAVYATGSRSAWLGALTTLALTLFVAVGRARAQRYALRFGLPAAAVLVLLVAAAFEYPPLRLAIFHSNPGDPTLTEGSTDLHFKATADGLQDALSHPFGRGPGQAGPASFYTPGARIAENYYVQIAQEVGLVGLGLLLAILFLTARGVWRLARQPNAPPLAVGLLASFWGIALINLLLHGWADDPTALVWWAMAGLVITPETGTPE